MKRVAIFISALVLLAPISARSNEANQEKARRLVDEVYNGNKIEVVDELMAEELVRIGPTPQTSLAGKAAFKAYLASLRSAYPDLKLSIKSLSFVGETVVMAWRFEGTNTGPGAYPPTGRPLVLNGTSHVTFEQGKIVTDRLSWDALGASSQLGLPPMPTIEGVWERTRVAYSNPDTSWVREAFQNNLMLIGKAHYSIMYVNSETPRKLFKERRDPTDEEKLEAYGTFIANCGTYEATQDSITFRPVVAKNPNYMSGDSTTTTFSVTDRSLRLIYTGTVEGDPTKAWVYHVDHRRIE